jgi:hypothetical protein
MSVRLRAMDVVTDKGRPARLACRVRSEEVALSLTVLLLIAASSVEGLLIAVACGLFRERRLPATRHARRVTTDPLG